MDVIEIITINNNLKLKLKIVYITTKQHGVREK